MPCFLRFSRRLLDIFCSTFCPLKIESRRRLMTAEQAARLLEEDSSELNGSDSDIEIEVGSLVWFVYI